MMVTELQYDVSCLKELIGRDISLHGRLFVLSDETSRLAASYKAFKDGECIEFDDQLAIGKALLTILPVSGGGDCLYDEECYVVGTLFEVDDRKRLVKIVRCTVIDEYGDVHEISIS